MGKKRKESVVLEWNDLLLFSKEEPTVEIEDMEIGDMEGK